MRFLDVVTVIIARHRRRNVASLWALIPLREVFAWLLGVLINWCVYKYSLIVEKFAQSHHLSSNTNWHKSSRFHIIWCSSKTYSNVTAAVEIFWPSMYIDDSGRALETRSFGAMSYHACRVIMKFLRVYINITRNNYALTVKFCP